MAALVKPDVISSFGFGMLLVTDILCQIFLLKKNPNDNTSVHQFGKVYCDIR